MNPDALRGEYNENYGDVESNISTSLYLEGHYLRKFMVELDDLAFTVIDSFTLKETLHFHGINMKYLGFITSNTTIPYIMTICLTDIIARSFKKIINSCLTDLYLHPSRWIVETPQKIN